MTPRSACAGRRPLGRGVLQHAEIVNATALARARLSALTLPRDSAQRLIIALSIVGLAWFSMKFYMDNSNDSETEAYVGALTASATQGTLSVDATGHYAALAPYVLWPFTT